MTTMRSTIVVAMLLGATLPCFGDGTSFAWQDARTYRPPSFEDYFPEDPEAGEQLDLLYKTRDRYRRSDEEILETVRKGLRCTKAYQGTIISWIGSRYIWEKSPQHPLAIELMYHAADPTDPIGTRHNAIYTGLAVVEPKSPAILHALVDLCILVDDPNDLEPIAQGASSQRDELLKYLQPHLTSDDEATREKARVVERIFKGELTAVEWATNRTRERAEQKYTEKLPELKHILQTGDSESRIEALGLIGQEGIYLIMDETFIDAFASCASDPDHDVRVTVAMLVGQRWFWDAPSQAGQAIDLMLTLSRDKSRMVRHNAVYYGLSLVRQKDEKVVRRLLEMAIKDRSRIERDKDSCRRMMWGLKDDQAVATRLLNEYLRSDDWRVSQDAIEVYRDLTGNDPPADVGLDTKRATGAEYFALVIGELAEADTAVIQVSADGTGDYQTIQAAIDDAPDGATIRIGSGHWKENLIVTRPVTLEGAGWDETRVIAASFRPEAIPEFEEMIDEALSEMKGDAETIAQRRKTIFEAYGLSPALTVRKTAGLVVRNMSFLLAEPVDDHMMFVHGAVNIVNSVVKLEDCAILQSSSDGLSIRDNSQVQVKNSLIANSWHSGVSLAESKGAWLEVSDSDIRNNRYAGLSLHGADATIVVKHCRITGAGWHGISYGDCSPTIENNFFGDTAVSGIYARGKTAAKVRNNLFFQSGMWCQSQNADTIESNTFVGGAKAGGMSVTGASQPLVRRNIFTTCARAAYTGDMPPDYPFAKSSGEFELRDNVFWSNEHDLSRYDRETKQYHPLPLAAGNLQQRPQFVDAKNDDFNLEEESPLSKAGIGARGFAPHESSWPQQPEEQQAIQAIAERMGAISKLSDKVFPGL